MHEMHKLMTDEKSQRRLDKALERLNSLEKEYSRIVPELIAILPNEESVNDEVRKWVLFQQEILEITMLAEQQISLQTEDTKRQFSTTSPSNPVSSQFRLPKFTLSEFTGNILEWVSWWDQYKICIHDRSGT
jgi:hypothetical protein